MKNMFGYQQPQRNIGELLKQIFLSKTVLSRLILINTVVFLFISIINLFTWLFALDPGSNVLSAVGTIFALPSSLSEFATKPWTIFTYMFLQEGFGHLFFNMIMLYFGGKIFREYLSPTKLFWTYIMGGLMGAVFFIAAFNIFPIFDNVKGVAVAVGSSASVLAILIAIASYVPDYSITLFLFGKVKLKYIALIFIAYDILSISAGNAGGHIAHLGGAFWGFIYAYYLRRGNDIYKTFDGIKMPEFGTKKRHTKFDTSRPKTGRPIKDDDYNIRRSATQEEIDRILDKISKSGYDSLSKEEKDLLFKSSSK